MNTDSSSLSPSFQLDLEARVDDIRWKDKKIFKNINEHSLFVAEKTLSRVFARLTSHISINLSLLLTHNHALRRLNFTFRQNDKPTNVLSFPDTDLKKGELDNMFQTGRKVFLGDIAISYDKIAEEWPEYADSFQNHFDHMLVHGILHLCGYDHQSHEEAEIMEKLEQEILLKFPC